MPCTHGVPRRGRPDESECAMSDKSISAGDVEKLRIILPDATLVLCQVQSNARLPDMSGCEYSAT